MEFKHTHSSAVTRANRPERATLIDLMKQELLSIKLSEPLDISQADGSIFEHLSSKRPSLFVTSSAGGLQVRRRFLRQPRNRSLRPHCSLKCAVCSSIRPNSAGDGAFISPSVTRLHEQRPLGCKIMIINTQSEGFREERTLFGLKVMSKRSFSNVHLKSSAL